MLAKNERTSMSSERTEYPLAPDFRSHPRRNKPPGGAQLLVQRHAVRFVGHQETPVFPGVVHVNRVAKLVDEDVAHQNGWKEQQFQIQADPSRRQLRRLGQIDDAVLPVPIAAFVLPEAGQQSRLVTVIRTADRSAKKDQPRMVLS